MENIGGVIVLSIIVIILIWIVLKYMTFYKDNSIDLKNYTTVIKSKMSGNVSNVISGNIIPTSQFSNEYAISFWIHIADYTYRYGSDKTIMIRGSDELMANPKIVLAGKTNSLLVKIGLQTQDPNAQVATTTSTQSVITSPTATASEKFSSVDGVLDSLSNNSAPIESSIYGVEYFTAISGNIVTPTEYLDNGNSANIENQYMTVNKPVVDNIISFNIPDISGDHMIKENFAIKDNTQKVTDNVGVCLVDNIPLQKWIHVVVSVYNNIVDIYTDGKLSSSCVLRGFPLATNGDLRIVPEGGFSGSLSSMVVVNSALNPSEVESLYNKGPLSGDSFWETIKSYFTSVNVLN
jgi:hypothetical protein